jgi:hypothetical protein
MADIRIKDLATTATTTASDDFMAVDGATNGTRKMNAAAPAFLTSVTTPSLTSPAATNLTLGLGTGGTALTLTSSTLAATFAGNLTISGGTVTNAPASGGPLFKATRPANTASAAFASLPFGATSASNVEWYAGLYGSSAQYRIWNFNGSADILALNITETGNVLIGTTSETGLTGAGGLKINSSTAGSAGAGALVVTGGLSAGGASYFAGAVTATGNFIGGGTANQFNAASAELKIGAHTNTTTSPILSMSTGGVGGNSNLIKFYTGGVDLNAQIKNPVSSQTLEIYAASTLAATFATTGTTFAGTVIAPAATASLAPLRIPHGTAPTSPTNGDMWTTTAGLYIRINGATVGPLS